jgi:hypothetical protein
VAFNVFLSSFDKLKVVGCFPLERGVDITFEQDLAFESLADASNPNQRTVNPSLAREVTGSKTAIVAIGSADI